MMDWTETLRLLVTVAALAVALTSLVTRRRDRLLDAIKDLSNRVTRVETRLDGLENRVESLDKRVESIETYIRSGASS